MEFSQATRGGNAVILVDVEESSLFQMADEVLPYLGRVPKNVNGRPLAWLGAFGLEPMDRDVASFLKLSPQTSGAVVSEVLENSPAEKRGPQGPRHHPWRSTASRCRTSARTMSWSTTSSMRLRGASPATPLA